MQRYFDFRKDTHEMRKLNIYWHEFPMGNFPILDVKYHKTICYPNLSNWSGMSKGNRVVSGSISPRLPPPPVSIS